eukprot:1438028-Amphidinium_carterae.1
MEVHETNPHRHSIELRTSLNDVLMPTTSDLRCGNNFMFTMTKVAYSKHNKHSFQSHPKFAGTSTKNNLRINSRFLHYSKACQDHLTNTSLETMSLVCWLKSYFPSKGSKTASVTVCVLNTLITRPDVAPVFST